MIFITITEDELQTCSTTLVLDISNTSSNINDNNNTEVAAATKIQATYRGYATRKRLKSEDDTILVLDTSSNINDNRNTEVAAATKIQATYRGYATRKRLKSESDRVFSATPSQAVPAVDNAPSHIVGDAIEDDDISSQTSDDTQNESGDTRTESGDTRTESDDTRTESDDTRTESDDTQNESGNTEKEHDSTETIEQINVEPGVVEESVERQEDKESVKQDIDEVLQESTADDTD